MRRTHGLLALGLLLAGGAAAAAGPLPAETLSGVALKVPDGLAPAPRLLVIGFSHGSRPSTKDWDARLAALCGGEAPACYDVAVIDKMPRFVRGFATGRMRDEVQEARHARFLLVTQDGAGWRALAGAPDEPGDDAYLVVLAADGALRWRGRGAWSAAREAELRQALAAP